MSSIPSPTSQPPSASPAPDQPTTPAPDQELRVTFIGHGIPAGVLLIRALRGDTGAAADLADRLGVPEEAVHTIARDRYRADLERLALAVSPEGHENVTLRVLAIAGNPQLTIDQKLREIVNLDDRFLEFRAPRWACLLQVSRQAIERSQVYREVLPKLRQRACRDRRGPRSRRDRRSAASARAEHRDVAEQRLDDLSRTAENAPH